MTSPVETDVVRRRPKDRRSRIVTAAAALFRDRGYRQVGMADVAAGVGVGASALYRHFRSKSDLLVAVIDEGMAELEQAVRDVADPEEFLAAVVAATLRRREHAALWDRYAAEIPRDVGADLRARRERVLAKFAALTVQTGNTPPADAIAARAALAVSESLSRHHVEIEPDQAIRVLSGAALACLYAGEPPNVGSGRNRRPATALVPRSRREALLDSAGRLFAQHGFHAVSLGEIGAAVGITGPSVYHHFPSKLDLLTAILHRGNEVLWYDLHRALAEASDTSDALHRVIDSYATLIASDSGVVVVVLSEVSSLPEDGRERWRALQRAYVAEWVELLRRSRPELSDATAHVLVHAALAVINTLGPPAPQTAAHHPADPGAVAAEPVPPQRVRVLAQAVLDLPAA